MIWGLFQCEKPYYLARGCFFVFFGLFWLAGSHQITQIGDFFHFFLSALFVLGKVNIFRVKVTSMYFNYLAIFEKILVVKVYNFSPTTRDSPWLGWTIYSGFWAKGTVSSNHRLYSFCLCDSQKTYIVQHYLGKYTETFNFSAVSASSTDNSCCTRFWYIFLNKIAVQMNHYNLWFLHIYDYNFNIWRKTLIILCLILE